MGLSGSLELSRRLISTPAERGHRNRMLASRVDVKTVEDPFFLPYDISLVLLKGDFTVRVRELSTAM